MDSHFTKRGDRDDTILGHHTEISVSHPKPNLSPIGE